MKKPVLLLLVCAVLLCGTALGTDMAAYPVTFEENQTTGYMWFYAVSDETVLAVTDHGYQPKESSGDIVGAGGTHAWTITGAGAGEASVSFCYAWAWAEELPEPVVTYTFSSDAAGKLTLVSTEGLPEQYMSGTVAIRLMENPTTGYTWAVEAAPQGMLTPVRDVYEADAAAAGAVGAGGVHTWIYKSESAGTAILTFRYGRSFEEGSTPASELMLTYIINGDLSVNLMGLDGDYSMYIP
jgi:predicted secreted protein